jgi:hypothetical protein
VTQFTSISGIELSISEKGKCGRHRWLLYVLDNIYSYSWHMFRRQSSARPQSTTHAFSHFWWHRTRADNFSECRREKKITLISLSVECVR